MRLTLVLFIIMALFNFFGCAKKFVNKTPIGQKFPSVQGQSLDKKKYNIPEDFFGEKVLFLIGFVQNTQFDIDRWTIGLDQRSISVKTFELPAPDEKTVHSMIDFELERHFSSGLGSLYYTYQINKKKDNIYFYKCNWI